jgi:hypothetical protein
MKSLNRLVLEPLLEALVLTTSLSPVCHVFYMTQIWYSSYEQRSLQEGLPYELILSLVKTFVHLPCSSHLLLPS